MRPLITIITPVFNASAVIAACIQSVQSQQGANFEHLIVDGLSSDDTVAIVQGYQQKHANLRLVSEKDSGVYDAMNKGITLAKGEWIFFLGADDTIYDPGVLQKIESYISNDTSCQLFYGDVFYTAYNRLYDGVFNTEKILQRNVCHQAVFYHSSVFQVEGLYKLAYRTEADYELNLRCWLGNRIRHQYIPLNIAIYADSGLSAAGRDQQLVADYPVIITEAILGSNLPALNKIRPLAAAYRKVIQRYPMTRLKQTVFTGKHRLLRLTGLACMLFLSPFYLIKRFGK